MAFEKGHKVGVRFQKGHTPWNKGKKTGISHWRGKHFSEGHKKKLSEAQKGEKAWNWKGGKGTLKERQKGYNTRFYRENREKLLKQVRDRRKEDPEWAAEYREKQRKIRERLRKQVIKHLGGKCNRCGFDDWRALQIDHREGGGHRERVKLANSTHRLYKKVLADTSGKYQLLCANCNWIKRYENKETK